MEESDQSELHFLLITLERSYLVQVHTFWKLVHVFFVHNTLVAIGGWPPKGHFILVMFMALWLKYWAI